MPERTYTIDLPVFQLLRGRGKLTNRQLTSVVRWVNRSPIWKCLLDDFVDSGGVYQYAEGETNYYWTLDTPEGKRLPTINVSTEYKGAGADLVQLAGVMCHELAHYLSYYRCGFNPNNEESSDRAAVMGVWDEGRAHTLEFIVQDQIDSGAEPTVEWMKEDEQGDAIEASRMSVLQPLSAEVNLENIEAAMENGAHLLWQWVAKYTGPDPTKSCYLQFYKDCWFDAMEEAQRRGELTLKEQRFDVDRPSIAAQLSDGKLLGISYNGGARAVRYAWASDFGTIAAFKRQDQPSIA